MIEWLFWVLLIPNTITFCVVVYNFISAPRMRREESDSPEDAELISVLIPARNEEHNISACLESVCNQTHKNLEIIVLDDQSTDKTARIVREYSLKDNRVMLMNGLQLPEGWLGKNWACHNLSLKATSEKLLLIDSDVRLREDALSIALNKMKKVQANMLSVFPSQIVENIGTSLVTPLMNWLLLTFLPLIKVSTSRNQSFVAANGQFILIDRNDYLSIGGHEKVKHNVVEDMELARAIKRQNKKVITLLGDTTVYCKMYSEYSDSYSGFSKNFFPGFNTNYFVFFFLLHSIALLFFLPFILAPLIFEYAIIVGLILTSRIIIAFMSKQNILREVILHPVQMIMIVLLGINSVIVTKKKTARWKGRLI